VITFTLAHRYLQYLHAEDPPLIGVGSILRTGTVDMIVDHVELDFVTRLADLEGTCAGHDGLFSAKAILPITACWRPAPIRDPQALEQWLRS
jgi:hypothetical protein